MITRFDHAVIAVADLEKAMGTYQALGFEVARGGRHEHRGTHNAIVRFGVEYLELLSVYDPDRAVASGHNGRALVEFLQGREGGLVGYALATDDAEADAARFRNGGLEVVGPFEMRRERPDGRVISWRLVVPVDIPWRRSWPFFIQWDELDKVRLQHERIGGHANTATGVTSISVAVHDLHAAVELYTLLLGAGPVNQDQTAELPTSSVRFQVGGFTMNLVSPPVDAPLHRELTDRGEGPYSIEVEVANPVLARTLLSQSAVEAANEERAGILHVSPTFACGARLALSSRGKHSTV